MPFDPTGYHGPTEGRPLVTFVAARPGCRCPDAASYWYLGFIFPTTTRRALLTYGR